jgi:glycosyltransferase involved in cell wall biosynthesis
MSSRKRYAFVVPHFGEDIIGGATMLVGELAKKLQERGDYVEIWTTCAKDNRTWANHYPEGQASVFGLRTLRFPVDERDLEQWIPRQIAISEGMNLPLDEQVLWLQESVNASKLYELIVQHAAAFDAVFYAPYLFGTTFWGSLLHPANAVLIPCLHDETYAYTDVIAYMFSKVAGCLFNAIPEQELASRLYGTLPGGEVGMGFKEFEPNYIAGLKPFNGVAGDYILYAGRKEQGKNAHLLVDYFIEAKSSKLIPEHLKLVFVGGGSFEDLHRPDALLRDDIIDAGHVSEQDLHALMHHALVLCQPSTNESFSIVMMESWLLDTPCLVHADCAVTRSHAISSGGGLYFSSESDFGATVRALALDASLARMLAEQGKQYVLNRYAWSAVLERFDSVMATLFSSNQELDLTVRH